MSTPQTLKDLKGVGVKVLERLAKLGIVELTDLLFHLPIRYQDRTKIIPIGEVIPNSFALVEGRVVNTQINYGLKRSLNCLIEDDTGQLLFRFFYFAASQQKALQPETRIRCFGEIKPSRSSYQDMEMIHPEYQILEEDLPLDTNLTPIYPTTEGLSQNLLNKLIQQVLPLIDQLTPITLLDKPEWPDFKTALLSLHQPESDQDLSDKKNHPAILRLAFEELVAHNLSLRQLRFFETTQQAPIFEAESECAKDLVGRG